MIVSENLFVTCRRLGLTGLRSYDGCIRLVQMRRKQIMKILTGPIFHHFKCAASAKGLCPTRHGCGKKLHSSPPAGSNRSKDGPSRSTKAKAPPPKEIFHPEKRTARVLQKKRFLSYKAFLIYFFLQPMLKKNRLSRHGLCGVFGAGFSESPRFPNTGGTRQTPSGFPLGVLFGAPDDGA
ncbi:hypothetical protein H4684_000391 [Desulfomicrobium macestii]|uniref:Uncharacterized protein n=1 Tax=Desulfomicrobium macestii TaxID=90731 RepID=A0ABR9GZ86_9BACT|nr:hypothetical protein [Desulfomicrobium macestii]MBE1423770.1 hypothetical protein [Desulfomicrobium macestii]